ncbi:MAG: hypothetical protein PHX01_04875 [Clostridia bacterium]|nr:hypothetical protein [Clostridia bacterium]
MTITTGKNNSVVAGEVISPGCTLPLTFTVAGPDENGDFLTGDIIVWAEKVESTL